MEMKTIEPVSIWDNGTFQEAKILNTMATAVMLDSSAIFNYQLFSQTPDGNIGTQVAQGFLNMVGEAYTDWTVDNYAWNWVAEQLNLVITGDYVQPVTPEEVVTE